MISWLVRKIFSLLLILAVIEAGALLLIPAEYLPKSPADALVVLGAAPNSPALVNRTRVGLENMENNMARALVFSGGKTSSIDESEAENMRRSMNEMNFEFDGELYLEKESTDTWENLFNTKKRLPNAKSLIVVTDRYHLARSFMVAKMAGFEDVYWDSPDSGYYPKEELKKYYFREAAAIPWYVWRWIGGRIEDSE